MKTMPMKIVKLDEPWSSATLENGSVVRARLIFDKVMLDVDEKGQPVYDDNGDPNYNATFKWVVSQDIPETMLDH